MVLRHHGRSVGSVEIRDLLQSQRDGATARQILEAARRLGLVGHGLRLETQQLRELPAGSILHWSMRHFVVLERCGRRGAAIVDPAIGRRQVGWEELDRCFTGVALVFEPARRRAAPTRTAPHLTRYVSVLGQHRWLIARVLIATVLLQALGLGIPIVTGAVVDRVAPAADLSLLQLLTIGIFGITVASALAAVIRSMLMVELRTVIEHRLTSGFVRHLLGLPLAFFQSRTTGDLLMRLNSHTNIREILTSTMVSGSLDALTVTAYVAILFSLSPSLGWIVLLLGGLRVLVLLLTWRRTADLMAESLQAQAVVSGYQVQMIEGAETVKATAAEERVFDAWSRRFNSLLNLSVRRGRVAAGIESVLVALSTLSPMWILVHGTAQVVEGHLSLGTMLAANAVGAGFLGPLTSLVSTAQNYQLMSGYVARVEEVLTTPPEQPDPRPSASRIEGHVRLETVSFRYSATSPWVLRALDLEVRPGQMIAIVGPVGSGKSTLARLLVGLHAPTEGRVRVDGRDLHELDLRTVRKQVGFVPQMPCFFDGSVRENLALGHPDLPSERIEEAARRAGLHEEVMRWPLAYETPIVSAGDSLSGGQRQLLALARALVGAPRILVLDEATSHLDAVCERAVQRELAALEVTRVIVAHRLSTIRDADLIVVMQEGRIRETGTHDQLLLRGGAYAALFESQVRLSTAGSESTA
jgi:ABC-type bacteriocin/lantibiotic exporter with double-glycine peptidase domain